MVKQEKGAKPAAKGPRFLRRGWFWFALIVVEVGLALVVSVVFEVDPNKVDLAGVDLTTFCKRVESLRSVTPSDPTANTSASQFELERDAYRGLGEVSPPDLAADLAVLAQASSELAETAIQEEAKKKADPSYLGFVVAIIDKQEELRPRTVKSSGRVGWVVTNGCGIDLNSSQSPAIPGPTGTNPPAEIPPGTSTP